ncbi:hypothetical protein J45TS6_10360 [Paenibacillus sp. J45TS6]|uniref:hypothetical protein n=1 Tax=Paenibacillus sp. J45TS6 TaxID=2807196 RepID=UPI001B09EABD|nr:hypothetical protein [Paenibacillus sp. J45TS6]GIP42577.1 hypothetical protein J45TS6_10360 [Paenibacillus sp. J45TS6]
MEEAAEERRNYHAIEDGRIQSVSESPVTELIKGGYVHALINETKSTENRRSYESYKIKVNGLDLEEATIEINSSYLIEYERDSAGVLKQISFWKEGITP